MIDLTDLQYHEIGGGNFELLRMLRMRYVKGEASITVIVNKGFVSDGFSVPWFARWIISTRDKGLEAAVIHDWLCANKWLTSAVAHTLFESILRQSQMSRWRRFLAANAVYYLGPKW